MNLKKLTALGRFLCLFTVLLAPERFIKAAVEDGMAYELETNQYWARAYQQDPDKHRAEFEATARSQTRKIRRALFWGLGLTFLTIAVGWGIGVLLYRLLGAPSKTLVYALQAIGAAILLGATLAEIGRKVETLGRRSLPEEINALMFRALYVIGTLVFVLSFAWDASPVSS